MKITSDLLKCAVMSYYRFNRGYISAEEVFIDYGRADVLVDTGKSINEIEIKISKHDLMVKELEKLKHKYELKRKINKFYICVPDYLKDCATEFIQKVNNKYGLIIFNVDIFEKSKTYWRIKESLEIVKRAKNLNDKYNEKYKEDIVKRLSSKVINDLQTKILGL